MRLFYAPDIESIPFLTEEDSKHAIKVLRLKEGDLIEVIDGKGNSFTALIEEANTKKCKVSVQTKKTYKKKPYFLEIIVAPTKNIDRIEWFVEKAIEIGIDKITFVLTDRSERKKIRIDRLQKIAISAIKQSKNHYLPELSELLTLKNVIETNFLGERFIAHCIEDEKKHLKNELKLKGSYQILIGPEGDFTTSEIDFALSNNFKPVMLGESRLRTETAALYAVATVAVLNA